HGREEITLPDEIDRLVQAVYEEQVDVLDTLRERLEQAQIEADGKNYAHKGEANLAIIGLPDDASWNDPARFVLYDEDEPAVHRSLMAKTRLGEDSLIAIPLFPTDGFHPDCPPGFTQAKQWYLRAVALSRLGVVKRLRAAGVPEGWLKSPLLRNCYPCLLDSDGRWVEDASVRLDEELGVVYEAEEAV
ncbi:MAG: CRISPR-associated helicase/endonuclease Cas3, partial [Patescibacteria group bacterium]|nr:CRISPR-associated helicase/endonuclease Cas3 [Patescibacteria group bacterium]